MQTFKNNGLCLEFKFKKKFNLRGKGRGASSYAPPPSKSATGSKHRANGCQIPKRAKG